MEGTEQRNSIEMTNVAFQGDDEDDVKKEPTNEEKKVPEKKPELTAEEAEELKKLFEAVIKGDLPLLRELHSKGAKLDVVNEDGNPLLHFPVRASNPAMVAFMVENKVDVNAVNRNGTDALQLASYAGDNEILEILVYAGANINHQDTSGNTALHFACQFNHLICSMQLINFGSRLDLINSVGPHNSLIKLSKYLKTYEHLIIGLKLPLNL